MNKITNLSILNLCSSGELERKKANKAGLKAVKKEAQNPAHRKSPGVTCKHFHSRLLPKVQKSFSDNTSPILYYLNSNIVQRKPQDS